MPTLIELPTELLLLIFGSLADLDLLSLFASRRTCRTIQTVVTDIISNTISGHGLAVHALLQSHFSPLLDSSTVVAKYEPSDMEGHRPFYALPWASDPAIRAKYLREEASWRQIPLASASGHLVHRLQVVFQEQDSTDEIYLFCGGHVGFRMDVEDGKMRFHFPQGVGVGLLYDMLLHYRQSYLFGGWQLLPETRVEDPEEFEWVLQDLADNTRLMSGVEIKSLFTHDIHHALLLFIGEPEVSTERNTGELWTPEQIGKDHLHIEEFPGVPWDLRRHS